MASAKALLGSALGRFVFHDAAVAQTRDLSPRLRRIDLEGEALRGRSWEPGDKVQVFLPAVGTRTFTPLFWDAEKGATAFLVYLHGSGPGSAWGRNVEVGARVQLFGPRRSLALGEPAEPLVLFGDETSLGVAHALGAGRSSGVAAVLEVSHPDEVSDALHELGLAEAGIARTPGDGHLAEVAVRLKVELEARPEARLVMTGSAPSIQAVQRRFRNEGFRRSSKVKAYWSPGKTGLD